MSKKLVIGCLMALLSFLHISTYAQVTVGTSESPSPGALLQLKSEKNVTAGGVNATKGLGAPRVYLPKQDQLKPMYTYDNAANTPSEQDLKEHVGLFVYNTNYCLQNTGLDMGPYVWDGGNWQPVFPSNPKSPNVNLNADQDGNIFKSRVFKTSKAGGINAGEWMVENLKAKKYVQTGRTGDDQTIVDQMPTSPAPFLSTYASPVWIYPGPEGANGSDPAYLQKQPELGLLYNWAAATNSKGKGVEDGSSNNSIANGMGHPGYKGNGAKTQGICPNGWHLPSDEEWTVLEQVIAADPSQFSRYTGAESGWYTWDPSWNTTDGYHPNSQNTPVNPAIGHGNAMKAICPTIDYVGSNANTFGQSLPSKDGGFAVLMVGYAYTSANHSYGTIAHLHSSTSINGTGVEVRIFGNGYAGVQRIGDQKNYGLSVRCKKDDAVIVPPRLIAVTCPSTSSYDILVGETINSYNVSYTSGTAGQKMPAYSATNNGITISHPEITLAASGTIPVTVSGTALAAATSVFNVTFGLEICPITIKATEQPKFALTCAAIPAVNNIKPGLPIAEETTITVPYESNFAAGSLTAGQNVIDGAPSVNGISVTVANEATIGSTNGSIVLSLSGTPTNLVNPVTIPITILGSSCTITVNMIDLADGDLPNAYIVKPGTKYTFPVTKPYLVWSNEPGLKAVDNWNMQPVSAQEKAEVLWSESTTSTAVAPIVTLNGSGKYATITIDATGISSELNAFVAYFDGTTVVDPSSNVVPAIRWSYHIWVTNYDPDKKENGTTYAYDDVNTNKQIMDRNLGALGSIYTGRTTIDAQGLLYQWGRKDPFPYAREINKLAGGSCVGCTYVPAITNFGIATTVNLNSGTNTPYINLAGTLKVTRTHGVTGAKLFPSYYYNSGQPFDWMLTPYGGSPITPNSVTVFNLWSKPKGTVNTVGGEVAGKGYYDPCPTGWRVPDDMSVFSKITTPNGTLLSPGAALVTPIGNFPLPGSTSASNATYSLTGAGGWGIYWTAKTGLISGFGADGNIGAQALNIQIVGSPAATNKSEIVKFKSSLGSVRCIKNL